MRAGGRHDGAHTVFAPAWVLRICVHVILRHNAPLFGEVTFKCVRPPNGVLLG